MRRLSAVRTVRLAVAGALFLLLGGALFNVAAQSRPGAPSWRPHGTGVQAAGDRLIAEGRHTFRFDTFGDEAFWGDALRLHRAIEGRRNGGVGPGVSPKTALAVGLKVDAAALPAPVVAAIRAGKVNLNDPKTTLALLKLNAVIGVRAQFARHSMRLRSIGITCALCHSTVDNSFAPGIGKRLDGWPNRDLNVGAIVSLSPNLKPVADFLGTDEGTVRKVLASWGPGKFDAELFLDGKAFQPDGRSAATLIPPAFGLAGVDRHTFEGWGSVTYWNAFVANLEMHGQGNFTDARLDDANRFPVAARHHLGHTRSRHDLISRKLPALHVYQLALRAPRPERGTFNARAAARGRRIFMGAARCGSCHMPPAYTEPGWNLHRPSEICTDAFQANRGPDGMYRTTPLRGLFAHTKGGFYHDGRFRSLGAVVDHYNSCMGLGLTPSQKGDLVQFLKSL